MIEQLVQRVFTTRHASHLAHWKTQSYAQHMALGDFYDSIVDSIDSIIEVYQGNFGLIGKVEGEFCSCEDILACLKDDAAWIAKNRSKISNGLTSVENLIDGLLETYLQTIYKLTNLH